MGALSRPASPLLSFLVLTLLASGCSDSGKAPSSTPIPSDEIRITTLVPARTVPGDSVLIQGTGFGADAGSVLFPSASGTVVAQLAGPWNDTALLVLVPPQAVSGELKVASGGKESNGSLFGVAQPRSYRDDVLPLFQRSCTQCHSGPAPQQNLNVLSREGLLRGGASGPAVLPRRSAQSLVVRKLRGQAGARMPLNGTPFTEQEILVVADWIDQGARPDAPLPAAVIQRLVPARTVVGDEVRLRGSGFGSSQGTAGVVFTSTAGTVGAEIAGAWTDTLLIVIVPAGAASGPIRFQRDGVQSNAVAFEVAPRLISFSADLSPILHDYGCTGCHAGGPVSPRLDVTSYASLLRGDSDHGPVVLPRDGSGSLIVRKLRPDPPVGERMPRGGPYLPEDLILQISDWIDQGATNN